MAEDMVRHVVLFGFTGETTQKDIDEIICRFRGLQSSVPGIEDFEWGENMSPERLNNGHTHGFVLTFGSVAARDVYLEHAEHVAFAGWVGEWVERVTVLDFQPKSEVGAR